MEPKANSKQENVPSTSGKRGRPKSSQNTGTRSLSELHKSASEDPDFKLTSKQKKFTKKTEKRMTRSQRPQVSDTVEDINSTSTHSSAPSTSDISASCVQSNDNTSTTMTSSSVAAIPSGENPQCRGRGRPKKLTTEVQIDKVQPPKTGRKKEQQPGPSSSGTSDTVEQKGHPNWKRGRHTITGKFLSKAEIKRRNKMAKAKIKQVALKRKVESGSSDASDFEDVAEKLNGRGTHAAKCKKKNLNVTVKRNELKKTNKNKLHQALPKSVINSTKKNKSESDGGDSDDEPHPKSTTNVRNQKKRTEKKKTRASSSSGSLHDVSDYDTDDERDEEPKKGNKNKMTRIKKEPLTESEDDSIDSGTSESEDDAQVYSSQRKMNRKNVPKATMKSKWSKRMKESKKNTGASSESEIGDAEDDDSEDDADMLTGRRSAVKKETIECDPSYSPSEQSSEDTSDDERMEKDRSDAEIVKVVKQQPKHVKKSERNNKLKQVPATSESENEQDEEETPEVENIRRSQRIQKKTEPTPVSARTDVPSRRSSKRPTKSVNYADMDDSDIEYISSSEILPVKDDAAKTPVQRKRKARASPSGNPNKKGVLVKVKEEPVNDEESVPKGDKVPSIDQATNPGPSCSNVDILNLKNDVAQEPPQRNRNANASSTNVSSSDKLDSKKAILGKVMEEPLYDEESIQKGGEVSSNIFVDQTADTEMEAPIPRNAASTSTVKETSVVSNHQMDRQANINYETVAPIPRNVVSTSTVEENSIVLQPTCEHVDIETGMEARILRNVVFTSTQEDNATVPQRIQRQVNIKTEVEAPIPRSVVSTATVEENAMIPQTVHRPPHIKTEADASIPRDVASTSTMEENSIVPQTIHKPVNIKTEVEDVEVGIKAKPITRMQNQSRPALPQAKNVGMHTRYSNSTTPQTSEFSNSVSPDMNVNPVRDVSTTTTHSLMDPNYSSSSQPYGAFHRSLFGPVETYWRPDQNNLAVPQTSTAHKIPMINLEPGYPNIGANDAMFNFNSFPSTSTQFTSTSLYSGANGAAMFNSSALDLGGSLQNYGQYAPLPYTQSTSEVGNLYQSQSMWPQYPDNYMQYAAPLTAPGLFDYNHILTSSPSTSSQPSTNQPSSTSYQFSKDIYKNVPNARKTVCVKKETGVPYEEASNIFRKYISENPNHQRRKMKFLENATGWTKHHINKWFEENRALVIETKLLAPTTQQALKELFHQKQFISKEDAKLFEERIGIPADKIYRWMFDRRMETFNRYTRSELKELPSQMEILEKTYTERKHLHFHNIQDLMQATDASFTQISGYFKSRRQYERSRGFNVVEMRNMEEERQEKIAGYDFAFPDAHWEFSISEEYLERYSYKSTNLLNESRELMESRIKARGQTFQHVPLPFNHSTDFRKWTKKQFVEFANQFLPYKPVTFLADMGVCGSQTGRFLRSDQTLFSYLKKHDKDGSSFTEEAFNSIGTKLRSIVEAEKQWMTTFNACPRQ